MQVLVMGVSGAGKTVVGRRLAKRLALPFLDADTYHSAKNIDKMSRGTALTDADRRPWLDALHAAMALHEPDGCVLACSALRATYRRRILRGLTDPRVVYLRGEAPLLHARLVDRRGHFMPPELLESQLATLEEPREALVIDASAPLAAVVRAAAEGLHGGEGATGSPLRARPYTSRDAG